VGKAKKFGIVVLSAILFFIIIGYFGETDNMPNQGCKPGYYPVSNTKCCPVGYILNDASTGCADLRNFQGSSNTNQGTFVSGSSGSYQGSSSGSSCGGQGSIFVTQPIYIVGAAVVEIDGYNGGITNMQIPVSSGSHYVEVWGITSSGYEQRMSWNTYVSDCKQTLIKWN